jgi:hypothetical protein
MASTSHDGHRSSCVLLSEKSSDDSILILWNYLLTMKKTIICYTGTPRFMQQLCSKEKSQRVKSHESKKENSFSPHIPPLPAIQYSTPPPHSIGQEAIHIKANAINWNRSKLGERIKMKLHFFEHAYNEE